ncbi:hypothetical protein D9M69_562430 [compost metagenome]
MLGWMNTGITAKWMSRICTNSGVPRKKLTYTVAGQRSSRRVTQVHGAWRACASRASARHRPQLAPSSTQTTVMRSVIQAPCQNRSLYSTRMSQRNHPKSRIGCSILCSSNFLNRQMKNETAAGRRPYSMHSRAAQRTFGSLLNHFL